VNPFARSAAFYDLVYRDKDYEGEAAFVAERARAHRPAAASILDLGCGTGRHLAELGRLGFEVFGVDREPAMVEACHARGVPARRADACQVRLGRRFDVVTALFHVVNYQTTQADLERLFATARAHAGSEGLFLFDSWWTPAVEAHPPERRERRVRGADFSLSRTAEPAIEGGVTRVDITFAIDRDDGSGDAFVEEHRMRSLSARDIDEALAATGFERVENGAFGTSRPPSPDDFSVHVVATCRAAP
jgi:SAM-dependent methyltransferase